MSPDENRDETLAQGYKIIDVPIEYRKDFDDNLNRALTEVAGVSVSYIDKFFSREYVTTAVDRTRQNPFSQDVLIIGLKDDKQYKDYFNPNLIPKDWQLEDIYMHFDTSKNKDRTGISAVSQSKTNPEEIHHLFTIFIEAPKNDQICFKKHEDFIFYLTDELGWNIKNASSDGFNSAQLKQNFILHGIDADYISPDRTSVPYLSLQRLLYDGLLKIIEIPLLEKEIFELNMNNDTLKIDHPAYGSKDGSDSLACAVQNCINHRTADDFIGTEYSEDDLAYAFKAENIQAIAKEEIFKSEETTDFDYRTVNKNDNNEDVDMEYFRF